jgi:hypothetical protein
MFIFGFVRRDCTKNGKVVFFPLEQKLGKRFKNTKKGTWFGGLVPTRHQMSCMQPMLSPKHQV